MSWLSYMYIYIIGYSTVILPNSHWPEGEECPAASCWTDSPQLQPLRAQAAGGELQEENQHSRGYCQGTNSTDSRYGEGVKAGGIGRDKEGERERDRQTERCRDVQCIQLCMYMYMCKHALSVFMFQYYKLTKMPRMDLGTRPHYSYMYVYMYIHVYNHGYYAYMYMYVRTYTCIHLRFYQLKKLCAHKKIQYGNTRH